MRPVLLSVGLAIAIVAAILLANRAFYFANPILEQGDFALNAIQIDEAKHGREFLGNYSRFRFHHPGPVFFYVYAGAEIVLCDWLKTGLSPFNAHSLAGLAIQAAFFAWGTWVLGTQTRRGLFVAAFVLVAAIQFSLIGNALISIWPPHVLLMPFFAFALACAALASGRGTLLPGVVLCGGFLVHGHVAQPLFVGGLFLFAYARLTRLLRATGEPPPWRKFSRAHLAAAGLLAFLLVPLVVDWLQGADSNLLAILRHLGGDDGPPKKFLKVLVYVLSFFGYAQNQDEALRTLSVRSLDLLRNHWPALVGWFAGAALSAWVCLRARFPEKDPARRFLRNLLIVCGLVFGLGVVWGRLQDGLMHGFNSYFLYTLPLLGVVPALFWASGFAEKIPGNRPSPRPFC